jgi:hypothetical protein
LIGDIRSQMPAEALSANPEIAQYAKAALEEVLE